MEKMENRHFINTKFEVRELGDGDNKKIHLQGYALTFDSISEDLGWREVISRGALDNCDMSNVILNINHNMDKPLARNKIVDGVGSLILNVDDKGLFFDAIPTDTSYCRDLIANMEAGVINKCSFCFYLDWTDEESQVWDWDDGNRGYDFRTIKKISEISDVSIVTNPAYESTNCNTYKRAKDKYDNDIRVSKELEERKLRKKKIEIELELL